MFMSMPQFEQAMPRALTPPGSRYWRALELSLNAPWLMVTVREDGFLRNFMLSQDSDLLPMLEDAPEMEIVGVDAVVPPGYGQEDGWGLLKVRRVWSARDPASPQIDVLVFENHAGELVELAGMRSARGFIHQRLLIELPS